MVVIILLMMRRGRRRRGARGRRRIGEGVFLLWRLAVIGGHGRVILFHSSIWACGQHLHVQEKRWRGEIRKVV